MAYRDELIQRLKDVEKWPEFDRPYFLAELNELADNAVGKKTVEGYLAALLIYQQLAEEMIKLLLKDHEFFIQLSVFPAVITFPNRSKAMFGRVIEDLKNSITLDGSKVEIIDLANRLNQVRIDLVHGLAKIPDIKNIESKVLEAKKLFDELFDKFDKEHDKFRSAFGGFRRDCDLYEELKD